MKNIAVLCAIALSQVDNANAIQLAQQEQGIFSKLMAQAEEENSVDKEIEDAKKRKAQQMIDAEKEHQALVEQEEKEEAVENEKKQAEYEERMAEKQHND